MFKFSSPDSKKLEQHLEIFAHKALPYAARSAINGGAFAAQNYSRVGLRHKMILRNKYTESQVRVDRARGTLIDSMAAEIGAQVDYLATQELGGIKRKTGVFGVPLATSYSAGLGDSTKPRTKLPLSANKMRRIQLRRTSQRGKSRQQRNFLAVRAAAATGDRFVYLDLGERRRGIFKVLGSGRTLRVKMIYDLSHIAVDIKRNPWLEPAVDLAQLDMPAIYHDALQYQVDINRLF